MDKLSVGDVFHFPAMNVHGEISTIYEDDYGDQCSIVIKGYDEMFYTVDMTKVTFKNTCKVAN